jgi:hypothetical protein
LLLINAVTNAAELAVGFHSFLALKEGIPAADVEEIRNGRLPSDPVDAALLRIARALIFSKGRIAESDAEQFLQAGFDKHLLEVIAVAAASRVTNYTVCGRAPRLNRLSIGMPGQRVELIARCTCPCTISGANSMATISHSNTLLRHSLTFYSACQQPWSL